MPASTSLRAVRRAVAPWTGYFLASTANSGTVSSLVDLKHPVRSSNFQEDMLIGKWLLRPDSTANDRVRLVAENGYVPLQGTLQPDSDWSAVPLAGEVYEIHGGIEPWDDLNGLVNTALMRCYVVAEFPVDAEYQATRHGLNLAAPWLQEAAHVRRLGYLYPWESRNRYDPYVRPFFWEAVDDEGKVYVEHGPRTFDQAETIFVQAIKPAYFSCRTTAGGAFGERSGLAADTHEAPVATEWLAAATLVEYWDRIAGQLPEDDKQARQALDRQTRWAAVFDTLTAKYLHLPARNNPLRTLVVGLSTRY